MQGGLEEELSLRTWRSQPVNRQALREATSARVQYRRLYRRVALTDAVSIFGALLLAHWIHFGWSSPGARSWVLSGGAILAILVTFAAFRLYATHRFTPAEEFRRLILAVSFGFCAVVTFAFWSRSSYSRMWLGISWGLALLLVLASRRVWHWRVWRAHCAGKLMFPTLIVGTNDEARALEDVIGRAKFGFRPLGLVSTEHTRSGTANGLPVLGRLADLRSLIRETAAECVFVASSALSAEESSQLANAVRLEGVEVRLTATLPQVLSHRLSVQPFGGLMALSLRPVRLTGAQTAAKRAFDLFGAGVALALLAPLLLVIAVAVRFSSPGPILFRQRRVGQRGQSFTLLKFRTMEVGAEARVEELRLEHGMTDLMFKLPDDPRVTPVGRLLRRLSLDELPQLINVLRGEMSLVGPRPALPEEVAVYSEYWHYDRLEARPGITGLWQVSGRSELSFEECVRLDLFYTENWSLAYDLYIVAKTVPVLLSRRGAY